MLHHLPDLFVTEALFCCVADCIVVQSPREANHLSASQITHIL